jgi:lipoate-protein ligase A
MPIALSVEAFYQKIIEFMALQYKDVKFYEYTEADICVIEQLATEKYKTWEWNFGYSPKYTFKKSSKSPAGFIEVYLMVEKGYIEQARIHGDFFNAKEVEELEQLLIGSPHNSEFIRQKLSQVNIEDYITGSTIDHFLEALF